LLGGIGLAFGAAALILSVSEAYRVAATTGVALAFVLAAAVIAWQVRRITAAKPRAFDATLTELEHDLRAIRP